jgi:hypothetical protein
MSKPENPSLVDFMWQPQNDSFSTQVTLRDLFAAFCAAGLNANPSFDEMTQSDSEASVLGRRRPAGREGEVMDWTEPVLLNGGPEAEAV